MLITTDFDRAFIDFVRDLHYERVTWELERRVEWEVGRHDPPYFLPQGLHGKHEFNVEPRAINYREEYRWHNYDRDTFTYKNFAHPLTLLGYVAQNPASLRQDGYSPIYVVWKVPHTFFPGMGHMSMFLFPEGAERIKMSIGAIVRGRIVRTVGPYQALELVP